MAGKVQFRQAEQTQESVRRTEYAGEFLPHLWKNGFRRYEMEPHSKLWSEVQAEALGENGLTARKRSSCGKTFTVPDTVRQKQHDRRACCVRRKEKKS